MKKHCEEKHGILENLLAGISRFDKRIDEIKAQIPKLPRNELQGFLNRIRKPDQPTELSMSNMDSHPLIAKSIGALHRKLKGYLLFDDKYLKDRDGIHFFQQGEIYDVDYLYAAADKFADEFFSSIKDYKKLKTANVDHNKVETLEETIEEFKKDKISNAHYVAKKKTKIKT